MLKLSDLASILDEQNIYPLFSTKIYTYKYFEFEIPSIGQ